MPKKLKLISSFLFYAFTQLYSFHFQPFRFTMSSTRRSTRLAVKASSSRPIIGDIMVYIDTLTSKYYQYIDEELNGVIKYYKDDMNKVVSFFIDDWKFDMNSFKDQYLLRRLFEKSGLDNPDVVEFLDDIKESETIMKLGAVRYTRDNKTHYRIRTGIHV